MFRDYLGPLVLLLAGAGGCQDLWSFTLHENRHNCAGFPASCAQDEVCNPSTEACEPILDLYTVSPALGPSGGGLPVVLSGRGFVPGTSVWVGQTALLAEPVTLTSETQLQATLPASPRGCGHAPIELRRPGGIAVRREGLFSYFLQSVKFSAGRALGTSVSASTVYVATQDLNQDGIMDIVSTAYGSGGIDILLGNGDGTFQTSASPPTGSGPYYIAIADIDNNGSPDIAVANVYGNTVSILMGTGGGQFKAPQNLANVGPESVQLIDADDNGTLDLVVLTNTGKVRLWKGDGKGALTFFSEAAIDAGLALSSAADVDGDGRLDLLVSAKSTVAVAVHRNRGDGTFALASLNPLSSGAASTIAADVNHDGKLDLIAVEYTVGLTSVMLGHGDGLFDPKQSYSTMPGSRVGAAADLNCDGNIDIVVSHNGLPYVSVLLGRGDGKFDLSSSTGALSSGTSVLGVAVADLDGDHLPDLVLGAEGTAPSVQAALNVSQ